MPNTRKYFTRWIIKAPTGLLLVSAGLCVFAHAALQKWEGAAFRYWFWIGALGLLMINTGIAVFGSAILDRVFFLLNRRGNLIRDKGKEQ